MMEHFAIDILNEYALEDLPDTERVVNPRWRDMNRQRNSMQSKLKTRQVRFAELTLHPAAEDEPSKFALWQRRKAALLEEIHDFERDIADLKKRLKNTDKHIQWDQLEEQDRFKKPAVGRKRLMDSIRMIAYRAETAMSNLLTSPTVDTAAARRLLQDLFATEADIVPDHENQRLIVNVHRSSRPAVDQAMTKLFEQINAAEIIYPGTNLRIVYDFVRSAKQTNGVTSTSPR